MPVSSFIKRLRLNAASALATWALAVCLLTCFALAAGDAAAADTPKTGLGKVPEASALGTLAAGTTLAFLMSLASTIKKNRKLNPLHLFSETVGGTVGGLLLVLLISDHVYLPFNTAVVICAVGGASGWGIINVIGQFLNGQYKINIKPIRAFEEDEEKGTPAEKTETQGGKDV